MRSASINLMDFKQQHNIEKTIDALRENLAYALEYYHVLEGLHEEAVASDSKIGCFPYLMSSIWSALFDALFLKLNHFVDRTKNVYSFYRLFKLIKRYFPDDEVLSRKVSEDEKRLSKTADPVINKIENWRKLVVAHLTQSSQDQSFYDQNMMRLHEIKKFLELSLEILDYYSVTILKRSTDSVSDVLEYYNISELKEDIQRLFEGLKAESDAFQ